MARKGIAEFGNLVVTYGQGKKAKGLIDYPEFFIPALLSAPPRDVIGASYIILQAELLDLNKTEAGAEPEWAIAFEFVKVQALKSEQELVGGNELVQRERRIPNDAPSALGVLVLRTHRLVYWGKTASAPSAKQFVQSVRTTVKQLYTEHLVSLRDDRTKAEGDAAVAEFMAATPRPSIEYVPILGKENIAEALKGFKTVKLVSLDVLQPNPEEYAASNAILRKLRKLRKNAGAKVTRLQHTNPDGLKPAAVQKQLEAAADDEHTTTKVSGINQNDHEEIWSDAKLSLHVKVNVDYSSLDRAAPSLVDTMKKELAHLAARTAPAEKIRRVLAWVDEWRKNK